MPSPAKKSPAKRPKKFLEKAEPAAKPEIGTYSQLAEEMENQPPEQQAARLKAEVDKLRNQLKLLDAIISFAPFPIWARDEKLAIKFCNNAYAEIIEVTPETYLNTEYMEMGVAVKKIAENAFDTGESTSGDAHIVVEGERRLFQITEIPLIGSGQMVGFATDISSKERAEEEIRLHARALTDFLDSSNSAMAVYGADMRLKSYNQSFVELWKLDEFWLDTHPLYGEVMERLRENRRLPEQANFQMFKKEHLKLFTNLIKPHEEFLYLPDGTVLRMIAIPHALGGLLFAYEDVTDRLALERNYNTLIAVQKATLDNLYEAVAVFGEDGRLRLFNPIYCKMWGLDPEFLATQPHISDVVEKTQHLHQFEGSWDEFREKIIHNTLRRQAKITTFERSDGKVLSVNFVPLPDGATLVTYIDITDSTLVERSLREKNRALEEADRLKSEFLANVSYELRSPLTSIKGFTEILQSGMFGKMDDKLSEYIKHIDEASGQLMELIDDILDVATIEAGFLKLNKSKFNPADFISHLVSINSDRSLKAGITLCVDTSTDAGIIEADELRLKQAVLSLISNALKFTSDGGRVTVGAKPSSRNDKTEVEIWVEDTGIGIPEKEKELVFQKFYKSGSTRAHKAGTGLGLTLAKNIVELHGGEVSIQSQEGKGTRVSIFLPME